TSIVVGDRVRFRRVGFEDPEVPDLETSSQPASVSQGQPQAIIEQLLPRRTLLTRSDSFKGIEQHPIVANAEQMLIVVSVRLPDVKWGLVDRMIVAARGGGLRPIICLNKIDLVQHESLPPKKWIEAQESLAHCATLGVPSL